ncbi:MAG TPA: EAL domain-containing protein [Gammaproteobacteria bacterium]|nr:EAL domain-containing protein [Gammaproteobacteria bacterium]
MKSSAGQRSSKKPTSLFASLMTPSRQYLWLAIVAGVALFGSVMLVRDIPAHLRRGEMGQQAIQMLDAMRRPLLRIKAVEIGLRGDDDMSQASTRLEQAANDAGLMLAQYREMAAYNPELAASVDRFVASYSRWVDAEHHLLEHLRQGSDESPPGFARHLIQANELFLTTMNELGEGEAPLHRDIHDGQQAAYFIQGGGTLLVIYLFLVILAYQRAVTRAIAAREEDLDITLQSIGDAVIATDADGLITRMNPVAERLTGWSQQEVLGRPLTDSFHIVNADSGNEVENPVEKVLREGKIVGLANHTVLLARDGTRRQIADSGAPIHGAAGEIQGVVLVFRDVTSDYDLQRTVQEHALRLQRIMESSMDAVIVADEKGRILEWNPQAETMFGWSRDEAVGSNLQDTIIPPEHHEAHQRGISRLIETGATNVLGQRLETTGLNRAGKRFPIELTVAQLHQSQGWLFSAFIRDLTEKRQIEATLSKHTAQLTEAQRIAQLGSWELDLENGQLQWSEETYRIFGLDPDSFEPSFSAFINAVHPDDRDSVTRAYQASTENRTPYDIMHRLLMTGGGIKYVRERCETSYDEQGTPLRSLGTVQDVTDSTIAEQELRLAATTFESHAGILITDAHGTILRVNPAFEAMTGYSASELVGQNPRMLQSDRQDNAFYEHMWSLLAETGQWHGELWNRHKDGHLYAELLTITAVRNTAGEITHYVGTTQDITERMRAEARVEHLAYYDDLTDLANRRLLRDRLQQEIAVARRHVVYGALLFIDLDQFKHLNDALGHPVGDELLRQVAQRLKSMVRAEDTVARLGGDEFVLVLPAQDKDLSRAGFEAQAVAEKVRAQLAESYNLNGHQYHMTASTGIVLFPEGDEDADDVLKHADSALYRAKEDGRNLVRFYQPSMQAAANTRLTLEKDLREALEQGGFELHYQPQVDTEGHIIGAEALIRWQHPQRGMVPPNLFIPVAEETGLILEIGNWVLRTALQQVCEWRRCGIGEQLSRLAVNVSPRQFHQSNFVDQVLGICEETGVSPDCIELEITESLVMNSIGETIEKMDELRARGVRFAIDDFGTGYSSLNYLKRLPLDLLKIDQSFVRDIVSSPNDAAIVDTIIAMTSHLGLGVIAEGVETLAQLEFLKARGCPSFQGFYYSRPVPAEELARLLGAGRLPAE